MPDQALKLHTPPATLFRNANFVLLWCAYGVSAIGDHLSEMAILKTQDALSADVDLTPLMARMSFMFFVPFFLLAPATGWLADVFPRRALMVVADVGRAVIVFFLAGLIAWSQSWGQWGAFAPLVLVGSLAALFSPARSALLPTVVRPSQLVRANGMISGLGIIATMVAAVAGGYLAANYAPSVAFRADAGTFVVSILLLLFLRPPKQRKAAAGKRHPLKDLAGGFRYAATHRHVLELLLVASLVWFCGPLVNSVLPAIVRDVYGGGYQAMSNCRAFLGLGFVLGAVTITCLGDALRPQVAITWGFLGVGLGVGILAASIYLPLTPSTLYAIGGVGVVLAGMFAMAIMASFNSLLQRTVADRYRGRIFGVKDLCCTASLLIATGLLGVPLLPQMDRYVGEVLIGVAVVMFIAFVVTLRARLLRGPHTIGVNFIENLNEFLCKFWWRLQRDGRAGVPHTEPVIVTSNHISSVDPLLLSAAAPYRLICFMIAAEYAAWPGMRFIVWLAQCIPVKRGTRQTSATKEAIRYLRNGKAVGIFIEGGIVPPGETARPKDGVAMLALRTGSRVIPAYISGMNYHDGIIAGLISRHNARVRFGPPVDLSEFGAGKVDRQTLRAATQKIYAAVMALAPKDDTCSKEAPLVEETSKEPQEEPFGGAE